jgi:hypothetical protein
MTRRSYGRPRLTGGLGRALLIVAVIGVVASTVATAAAAPPLAAPYSSAQAGNFEVSLPSAYPNIELNEIGNHSVASSLSIDQILEASPSATAPQIVAVALPSNVEVVNATGPAAAAGLLFTLSASLTVYPSNAGLWQGPGALVQPDGAPLGTAALSITYSLTAPASATSGVTTHWRVSGWPWASPSDLLGVQASLAAPLARSMTACTGTTASADRSGCPGTDLTATSSVWGSNVVGVQGQLPGGPTALVSWDPEFGSSGGPTAGVSAGALSTAPTLGHVVIAAPASGASEVDGNLSLALLPAPGLPAVPLLVHGEPGWYVIGLGLSVAAGLVGLLAYRQRGRGIERSL